MSKGNLFTALRAAFPADLDQVAIETADTPQPLYYTWRDLDRGTAMMANLLDSLKLPAASRVAVQVEKSVEALMLYLAVLRAGHVYLPLNNAYQASRSNISSAMPSRRWWCARAGTSAGSASSPSRPARVMSSRSTTTAAARCWNAPPSTPIPTSRCAAAATTSPPSSTPAAPPGAARARC
jgi:acyl-CoA synthetase (AMP-forming)/AMP-acid ligase II